MPRPILATIDPGAIAHNLQIARRHAPDAQVWAVIKANAYGHGITHIFDGLQQADGLALLDLAEAAMLRERGWQRPILLLEGFFSPRDLDAVFRLRLTPVVHSHDQLAMLRAHGMSGQRSTDATDAHRIDVYLKVNTGMNRLGFPAGECRSVHESLRALPGVGEIVLMTHFANADRTEGIKSARQRFAQATQGIDAPVSLANSATLLAHADAHAGLNRVPSDTWVRPGIMLYGASPFFDRSAVQCGLRPAMALTSAIIAVQELKTGDAVGYGGRFVADRPMRIGVVACGYADGYPRVAPDGTPIAVSGQRARIVGQVSMDMITVDLTDLPQAGVGAPVELWGTHIPVDEVAHAAGTVGYELLCALAQRVPMVVGVLP